MSSLVSSCISPSLPFSAFFCLFCYCIQLHRLAQRGAVRAQFLNSSYSTMSLHQSQISNQSTTKAMASFQVYIYIYLISLLNYLLHLFFNQGSVWQSLQKCVMFSRDKKKKKAFAVFVGCLVYLYHKILILMKYFISYSLFFFCFLIFMHHSHKNYKSTFKCPNQTQPINKVNFQF